MLGGLRDVIAEAPHHVQPNQIPVHIISSVRIRRAPLDFRIEVVARFILDFKQPRLMVDTGDLPPAAIQVFLHLQRFQQHGYAGLHAVTKADRVDGRIFL